MVAAGRSRCRAVAHPKAAARDESATTPSMTEKQAAKLASLRELRRLYVVEAKPLTAEIEKQLEGDPRVGVQSILRSVRARREKNRAEGQRLRRMLRYERACWEKGYSTIAGIDEAGMSPLAGPVVAGAIVLPTEYRLAGVDDSKKLDASRREELAAQLKRDAVSFATGFVSPLEIDQINIYQAGLLAMRRAVEGLSVVPDMLLIDARPLKALPMAQKSIIKGDQESFTIAAASIIAKTARDAYMCELDRRYPGYGFAKHKGYPVRSHVEALHELGLCAEHRRSFRPVREAMAAAT